MSSRIIYEHKDTLFGEDLLWTWSINVNHLQRLKMPTEGTEGNPSSKVSDNAVNNTPQSGLNIVLHVKEI